MTNAQDKFEKAMTVCTELQDAVVNKITTSRNGALGWAYFNFADRKFPKDQIISSPVLTDSDKQAILACFN